MIEELLGFTTSKDKSNETVTRKYYIRDTTPDAAKAALEKYAESLPAPSGLELGEVALDEEKNANGLYYGTITFKRPDGAKIKRKIADDLHEMFGEKLVEGRKSATHERFFRVKANTAHDALNRLEGYIRSTMQVSGRIHISDISLDEEQDGDGFFAGHVVYTNPNTHGARDKMSGMVRAYGNRYGSNGHRATWAASLVTRSPARRATSNLAVVPRFSGSTPGPVSNGRSSESGAISRSAKESWPQNALKGLPLCALNRTKTTMIPLRSTCRTRMI